MIPERRAAGADRIRQDRANARGQRLRAAGPDRAGAPARADPGAEQRLAGIDVAETGEHPLIEQRRLDRGRAAAQYRAQLGAGDAEGFGAQVPEPRMIRSGGVGQEVERAEAARIAERQPEGRAERRDEVERGMVVRTGRRERRRLQQEPPRHAEMEQDRGRAFQHDDPVLGAAPDSDDAGAGDPRGEVRREREPETGPAQ